VEEKIRNANRITKHTPEGLLNISKDEKNIRFFEFWVGRDSVYNEILASTKQ